MKIRVYKALFGCSETAGEYFSFEDSRKKLRLEKICGLVLMDSLFLGIEKYEEKKCRIRRGKWRPSILESKRSEFSYLFLSLTNLSTHFFTNTFSLFLLLYFRSHQFSREPNRTDTRKEKGARKAMNGETESEKAILGRRKKKEKE